MPRLSVEEQKYIRHTRQIVMGLMYFWRWVKRSRSPRSGNCPYCESHVDLDHDYWDGPPRCMRGWQCASCKRVRPWCDGGDGDLCDSCWTKADKEVETPSFLPTIPSGAATY